MCSHCPVLLNSVDKPFLDNFLSFYCFLHLMKQKKMMRPDHICNFTYFRFLIILSYFNSSQHIEIIVASNFFNTPTSLLVPRKQQLAMRTNPLFDLLLSKAFFMKTEHKCIHTHIWLPRHISSEIMQFQYSNVLFSHIIL